MYVYVCVCMCVYVCVCHKNVFRIECIHSLYDVTICVIMCCDGMCIRVSECNRRHVYIYIYIYIYISISMGVGVCEGVY